MKLSLQAKLITAALLVTLVVAVVLSWLSFTQLTASNQKSLSTEVSAQTNAFTTYLSNWAADRQSAIKAMRTAIESHIEANDGQIDPVKIRQILTQGKASVNFGMTFLGMEDGTMIRHQKSLDENRTDNYDPRVRGWYKAAKKAGNNIISKPYIAATAKKLAITFAEPIFINGEYQGSVGSLVYLDKILTGVLDLKVQGDGYAMLLDKSNIIAAHPNESLILKDSSELSERFSIDELSNNHLNKLIDIKVSGEDTLVYVSDIPNTNWLLTLVMKKDILSQPMRALTIKTLLVVVLILALATVGVTAMIRWLFADLKHVSMGLDNIAKGDGDLTLRIDTKSHDEIGLLANNFNSFVSYLSGIILNVRNVSDELDTQAEATAEHASSSAKNVKIQQDEMNLVATAVNEMNTATKDIALSANNASSAADSAVSMSNAGQEQVRKSQASINALAEEVVQASNVIMELDQHVQEISTILTTISGIAEQTNLLALNAAIEAARAGEQGRGFAVVADEVRVLSQRTHSSTEEIQNMINVLQSTAENAVKSMNSSQSLAETSVADAETASESLQKIQEEISSINDMVTQIATAAEEQTAVTAELNTNTNNIYSANETLAKESEESASRSQHLSKLTETLKNDLKNFKL
ncbi:MAG: methyl-accepting chemotaxis protein [Cellvibrionaceae bacterium]